MQSQSKQVLAWPSLKNHSTSKAGPNLSPPSKVIYWCRVLYANLPYDSALTHHHHQKRSTAPFGPINRGQVKQVSQKCCFRLKTKTHKFCSLPQGVAETTRASEPLSSGAQCVGIWRTPRERPVQRAGDSHGQWRNFPTMKHKQSCAEQSREKKQSLSTKKLAGREEKKDLINTAQ